jgi:hypothetical protein
MDPIPVLALPQGPCQVHPLNVLIATVSQPDIDQVCFVFKNSLIAYYNEDVLEMLNYKMT